MIKILVISFIVKLYARNVFTRNISWIPLMPGPINMRKAVNIGLRKLCSGLFII